MENSHHEPLEVLQKQVVNLRSRIAQLRGSRRVLMALLETIETERQNHIERLEAENRRLRKMIFQTKQSKISIESKGKIVYFSRNEKDFGEEYQRQ